MRTGTAVAERETCGDVDDVFFDATRQRVYVTCEKGQSTSSTRERLCTNGTDHNTFVGEDIALHP